MRLCSIACNQGPVQLARLSLSSPMLGRRTPGRTPLTSSSPLMRRHTSGALRKSSGFIVWLILLAMAIYLYIARQDDFEDELFAPLETVKDVRLCDPYSEPGYLYYNDREKYDTLWIPFGDECVPSPNWVRLIGSRDEEACSFLVNKTILVIGDSVDRNGVEHLANMLGLPRQPVGYLDITKEPPEGWDWRNTPWLVTIPWFNTTFTNGFLYGLDDVDDFAEQVDWHAPGLAEDRLVELIKPHTDLLDPPPSFISLHTGLWDLAFFGRKDRQNGRGTNAPLTPERMAWWQERFSSVIRTVQELYPGVPIWTRKLHRVGDIGVASSDDWQVHGAQQVSFTNYFTDVRIAQIRDMQEHAARQHNLPTFDFGENWEGLQHFQDRVHPYLFPGGSAYMQALIHHIWMESQGREGWRVIQGREKAMPLVNVSSRSSS